MNVLLLQGLIYVVDSNDRERINESAEELQRMVQYILFVNIYVTTSKQVIVQAFVYFEVF